MWPQGSRQWEWGGGGRAIKKELIFFAASLIGWFGIHQGAFYETTANFNDHDDAKEYWVTQKLPKICTVILGICVWKVA